MEVLFFGGNGGEPEESGENSWLNSGTRTNTKFKPHTGSTPGINADLLMVGECSRHCTIATPHEISETTIQHFIGDFCDMFFTFR